MALSRWVVTLAWPFNEARDFSVRNCWFLTLTLWTIAYYNSHSYSTKHSQLTAERNEGGFWPQFHKYFHLISESIPQSPGWPHVWQLNSLAGALWWAKAWLVSRRSSLRALKQKLKWHSIVACLLGNKRAVDVTDERAAVKAVYHQKLEEGTDTEQGEKQILPCSAKCD